MNHICHVANSLTERIGLEISENVAESVIFSKKVFARAGLRVVEYRS